MSSTGRSTTESSATPKPASKKSSGGVNIIIYIVWFFKIASLALCCYLFFLIGKDIYQLFANKSEGDLTGEQVFKIVMFVITIICVLGIVIAIYFENHFSLLIILIVLFSSVGHQVYQALSEANHNLKYEKLKEEKFIVPCILTGTFSMYLFTLCFFR